MKVKINQKVLEKALAHANWIIEKKQAIPVLGYVRFEATNVAENSGVIKITATNMDMTIVDTIRCYVEDEGSYCLPASLLYDITRKICSGSEISIMSSDEENIIKVQSNKASFSIHYIESDKFPPITEAKYDVSFDIKREIFHQSLDIAKVAMLQDNSRFHLNGIHVHYENELDKTKLRFVATDLFRISCISSIAPSAVVNMPSIIISKRAVGEMLKLMEGSSDDNVAISVSDTRISLKLTSTENIVTEYTARLINGTFPEYKVAIEVPNNKILIVNTAELIEAIDRVSTVVIDSTNSIKLNISKEKLVLSGISRELGSAIEELSVAFDAPEPLEICFNGRYLLEILKEIKTDNVQIMLNNSNSSAIIKPSEFNDNSGIEMIFALMPIEIVNN